MNWFSLVLVERDHIITLQVTFLLVLGHRLHHLLYLPVHHLHHDLLCYRTLPGLHLLCLLLHLGLVPVHRDPRDHRPY